jgi:hypothetical protein
MTAAEMLELAREIAGKFRRPDIRDDLASVALLGMLEAVQRGASENTRSHLRIAGWQQAANELDRMSRQPGHRSMSIHHAVTELIEEWKREPMQEKAAMVSEVRRIAVKALTPPQFDVVMARSREETHRTIAVRRRWSVGKAVKLEQDGMAALCDAVEDD